MNNTIQIPETKKWKTIYSRLEGNKYIGLCYEFERIELRYFQYMSGLATLIITVLIIGSLGVIFDWFGGNVPSSVTIVLGLFNAYLFIKITRYLYFVKSPREVDIDYEVSKIKRISTNFEIKDV